MCLPKALINVGGSETPGYIRKLRKIGPHSVRDARRRLIQAKMSDRVAISCAQYIVSAAKGDTFIAHTSSRDVGVLLLCLL